MNYNYPPTGGVIAARRKIAHKIRGRAHSQDSQTSSLSSHMERGLAL